MPNNIRNLLDFSFTGAPVPWKLAQVFRKGHLRFSGISQKAYTVSSKITLFLECISQPKPGTPTGAVYP